MIASQRARGLGHRAFYLHPEPTVGSGGLPNGTTKTGTTSTQSEPAPEILESTTTEAGTQQQAETADASK